MKKIAKNNNSIKQDILKSSIAFSFIFLFVFGSALSLTLYESGMSAARNTIKQRNYAVSYFIDSHISAIENIVQRLQASKDSGHITNSSSIDITMLKLSGRGESHESAYSYVVDANKNILLHSNRDYLGKNLFEIITTSDPLAASEGYLEYELDGESKIAYYCHTSRRDWLVITVINKSEIIASIAYKIGIYVLFIYIVSMAFGFAQSSFLSNKFSTPLIQLQRKVRAVVEGNWDESEANQPCPDNEIGAISQEIEKITTDGLYSKSRELVQLNDRLKEKAATDQLTKLNNRRHIDEELTNLYERLTRYNNPFSVILIDLDWFKKVNDIYGHQLGDTTLQELAKILKESVRYVDCVGRWGGEEFIILCPETHFGDAKNLAERIRSSVENTEFTIQSKVTISAGVAECSRAESIDSLIYRVDKNLYIAKENGRNTVV